MLQEAVGPCTTPAARRPSKRSAVASARAAQGSRLSYEGAAAPGRLRWTPREGFDARGIFPALPSASAVLVTVALGAILRVIYNIFAGRAMPLRGPAGLQEDGSVTFSVATFNLRGVMDRWQERRSLLGECLKQLDADVLCFQEVLTGEFEQDRQLLDSSYHVFPCKAALFNLLTTGGLPRWYAQQVSVWLRLAPLQRLLVRLPPAVEALRERYHLEQDLFRNIRDLTMAPFFGNSVACRLAAAHEINHSTLVLGDWRAAQRIEFALGGNGNGNGIGAGGGLAGAGGGLAGGVAGGVAAALGGGAEAPMKFWVVNTHLDHYHTDNRQRQALEVCRWMDKVKHDCSAIILCGDLNGGPQEDFHRMLEAEGYKSAYRWVHGREPQGTWPTGIQAPLMDHGDFECLDYIYVWVADGYKVEVLSAELHGLEPAAHDKTLYPSDHAAMRVQLRIWRDLASRLPGGIEVATTAARL